MLKDGSAQQKEFSTSPGLIRDFFAIKSLPIK
jgi:hypothetical protein